MNPQYPIYIISKNRWESRLTSKALDEINVMYKIVIESQEYDKYKDLININKILVLPFSNLGKGSIPARNWIWKHAISINSKKHWILDDNIRSFIRLNYNAKIKVASGTIFKVAEDFISRYENIALAGFNYDYFCNAAKSIPPYYLNSRIYSCILIRNDIPYFWRGKYNEDTDLSIRVLKDGWCTILFNIFLAEKEPTMQMKGGNTELLYSNTGRLKMARSLMEQHPDIVKVIWKFNKYQHQVDYSLFKKRNKLIRKFNIIIKKGINNYGMVLKSV